MERQPEVIIIGAGAAGLAAARLLTRAGLPVALIEARQRIGGRIHTLHDPFSPVPVELGAEFIHGRPPEIWGAIQGGRLPVLEFSAEQWFIRSGKPERTDEFGAVERAMAPMRDAPEQSFEQFIEHSGASTELKQWACRYVEGFHAARPELVSVRSLALIDEAQQRIGGDGAYRLQRGYWSLAEWLFAGADSECLRTYFGTEVETVRWRRGHVAVAGRSFGRPMSLHAPRAIVTVPLGVLQAPEGERGAIRFDPDPEPLRTARESIATGHAARITLRFRRPVWEDREELRHAGFLFSDEEWMPTWWTSLPVRAPVVTGWTGGPRAEARAAEDPCAWLAGALRTLARLLRMDETSLTAELEAWHTHNWSADPFARGAYSYVRAGGLEAQKRFGDPVEDTLYFAGEAVNAEGQVGTVHGAIAAGERAARFIV
ncbi:MAG TPA: NAD(P)/FAD-dependent oxidoreductase [Bryobacteraceae bacterium]